MEVGLSDIACVCSLRTSAPSPTTLASDSGLAPAKAPVVNPLSGLIPLYTSPRAPSPAQKSPTLSIFSTSDVYSSTQTTSSTSSNSLGLLPDAKLELCPQCGVMRKELPSETEGNYIVVEGETCKPACCKNAAAQKPRIWQSLKDFVRRCTRRNKPQMPTTEVHDAATPSPTSPAKEANPSHEWTNVRNRAGQTSERVSLRLSSPLQSCPPPDFSAPLAASPAGESSEPARTAKAATRTQMYSTLRQATADDDRLIKIMGPKNLAKAGLASKSAEEDRSPNIDEVDREDRERAEGLEKGRRLLTKSRAAPGGAGKKSGGFNGVGIMGTRL